MLFVNETAQSLNQKCLPAFKFGLKTTHQLLIGGILLGSIQEKNSLYHHTFLLPQVTCCSVLCTAHHTLCILLLGNAKWRPVIGHWQPW